jgi:hypothetical protein
MIIKYCQRLEFIIDPEEEAAKLTKGNNNINSVDEINSDKILKVEDNDEENNQNDGSKKRNETRESIKNLIKNKIGSNSLKAENVFHFLQPDKFSYGRNMYAHVFKELESSIKYKNHK